MPNNSADLEKEIRSLFWFHSVELGNGIVTPGRKSLEIMRGEFERTFSPIDLSGKTLIDIGAWSGAFSVEAMRRGARSVTALDYFTWTDPNFRGREAFDLVMRETGYKIPALTMDLDHPSLNLSPIGRFDVVLFLGVFYHLRDPIAALREVSKVAKEVLVLETHVDLDLPESKPAMMLYPGKELANDPTNWWGPNVACVVDLLKMNGFRKIDVTSPPAPNRKVFHAYR